jgi:hypothetical protein
MPLLAYAVLAPCCDTSFASLIDCGDEDVSAVFAGDRDSSISQVRGVHALARDSSDHFPVTPVQVPPNVGVMGLVRRWWKC